GNLISSDRIGIFDAPSGLGSSTGNLVQGNFIGTDITGTQARGNRPTTEICLGAGVCIAAPGNTIGGTTPEARNVISGGLGAGIVITEFGRLEVVQGNVIQGNFIGTDVTGAHALGNQGVGVVVNDDANTIGGTVAGAGNIIAFNGGGVLIGKR